MFTQTPPQAVRPDEQSTPHTPMRHEPGDGHTLPQAPQLLTSFTVSVQRPLQTMLPVGQPMGAQAPAVQRCPEGHALLQAPQWALLVAVSTHASPQVVCPVGQVSLQAPASHTWPVGQRLPHAPQLRSSMAVSVHACPAVAPASARTPASAEAATSHRAYIGPQVSPQAPSEQTRPAPHARPHAPQLVRSVCKLTQR